MQFSRNINLRHGVGATPIRAAAHFVSILLINAITLNAQIVPSGNDARPEARVIAQQECPILCLLARLADQAGMSADLNFAVRAQSQAATLLWPYDPEQARVIYRRAFQSLNKCDHSATPEAASTHCPYRPALTAVARQQVLHEIAERDPGLAEDLACAFTASIIRASTGPATATKPNNREPSSGPAFNASLTAASTKRDVEWRDLLASVAFRLVERDPVRSTRLAQLSLDGGVWPHFSRLLLSLREVDAGRADLLFAYAVGCLERSRDLDLDGLNTLSIFLVSATEPIATKPVESSIVVRFLTCVLAQLAQRKQMAADRRSALPAGQGIDAKDEAVIYFIGRDLSDLFARYMPNKLGQFKRKIAELSAANANDRPVATVQVYASNPNEIAREARAASSAAARDLLYARAAFAWLARGEVSRAQAAATEVAAAGIRDRILIQVARRYGSAWRLDDAVAVTRCIQDAAARADLLVSLAGAVLPSNNAARAINLLDEAVGCALLAPPSKVRALSLINIAGSFTAVDARRGFKVMQTAVETINEIMAQKEASKPTPLSPGAAREFETGDLYGSGFEDTFAALGRVDFDFAWSLAEQFTARDISVLAQLAVCRGRLAGP